MRNQWACEIGRHFPAARVLVVSSAEDLDQVHTAWRISKNSRDSNRDGNRDSDGGCVVAILTPQLAAQHVDRLEELRFDDLVVDEATFLSQDASVRTYPVGHFDVYDGAGLAAALADQITFLHEHLSTTHPTPEKAIHA